MNRARARLSRSSARPGLTSLLLGLVAAAWTPSASAQQSVGAGVEFQGYSFEEGLGASAAQLTLLPVGTRLQLSRSVTVDLSAAWAEARIERDGAALTLSGPVDTRVRASWQATPWALIAVQGSIPTGNATHSDEEAIVASVLSSDLLGFREATLGAGTQMTSSVAVAVPVAGFGVGIAGAWSVNGAFNPSEGSELRYRPGAEQRIRVGIDRNFGGATLALGGTFVNVEMDRADGRNLFQPGRRIAGDGSLALRIGPGVWTLYGGASWRERGDLTLSVVDNAGSVVRDSTLATPSQGLWTAGLTGALPLRGGYVFRPQVDLRVQDRNVPGAPDEGSGWIAGFGGEFPLRLLGRYDLFPRGRLLVGRVLDGDGEERSTRGAELGFSLRGSWSGSR